MELDKGGEAGSEVRCAPEDTLILGSADSMTCRSVVFACGLGPVLLGLAMACAQVSTGGIAEPRFLGVVALAVEDEVAEQLGLSEAQREALAKLVEAREHDALKLALQVQDLSPIQQEIRLVPFRRESEERGLALLTPGQRTQLEQVRIRRQGLASLMEPPVADHLELTEEQRVGVAELLRERADRFAAEGAEPHVVHAEFEQKLAALLSDDQRAAWEQLAFGAPPAPAPAPGDPPAPLEAAGAEGAIEGSAPVAATEPQPAAVGEPAMAAEPQVGAEAAAPASEVAGPPAPPDPGPAALLSESPVGATSETETASPPLVPGASDLEPPHPPDGGLSGAMAPRAATADPETAEPPVEPTAAEPTAVEPEAREPPGMSDEEAMRFVESLDEEPPRSRSEEVAEPEPHDEEIRLTFNFRYQPWEDVLEWFADQNDLSLNYETLPQGTCNYIDNREYSPAEALDVINSLLLIKGYTLVRNNRMLVLINLDEDEIPPILVSEVPVEELDRRGEYELVRVVFQLEKITADEAQKEIEKLLGPQGSITVISKAQQLIVTETAGNLRTIRKVLQRIEDPEGSSEQMRTFDMDFATAEDVLVVLRQLMGLGAGENATPDGSLRLALDPVGMRLIAVGKPSRLDQVGKIVDTLVSPSATGVAGGGPDASLQIEVYNTVPCDPQAVLKVMQTLLAGQAGARLSIDEKTGNLIALATPQDQATIRATLAQLQNDATQFDVIPLRTLDPQVAVVAIKSMFGAGEAGSSLKIDADLSTRRLLVRGTPTQIAQIRAWLEKMGESESGAYGPGGIGMGGNVRMLPLSGRAADSALERLQEIWPAMHRNRIRVVTPSAVIPTLRVGDDATKPAPPPSGERTRRAPPVDSGAPGVVSPNRVDPNPPQEPRDDAADRRAPPAASKAEAGGNSEARSDRARARFLFAAETIETQPEPSPSDAAREAREPAPIIVAVGPGGIMIASEDLEALNDFEQLLTTLAGSDMAGTPDVTVFYLIHSKAAAAAQILDQILGGGTVSATGASRGSLAGDMASAAFGPAGEMVSSLLGLAGTEGTITPSGSIRITPDERLNALIVQANAADLVLIEQLLKIIDQRESPEDVLAQSKPRMIPVYNTSATEVAEVVREVFQERMVSSGRNQRGPSPQEIMEALRGGGRGGRGGSQQAVDNTQKMSIGVDGRTNSLVVYAPDTLYQEVKELVEQLDELALESTRYSVVTVPLKKTNTEAVQKALSALVGDSITFGSTSSRSSTGSTRTSSTQSSRPSFDPNAMRQRFEMMRSMGGFGGGPPGSSFGGRGSRGR